MPTSNPQKIPAGKDWKPHQVKGALEEAGWSLRQLGFQNGYRSDSALSEVFRRPWPRAEAVIAKALGIKPWHIWPSRYDSAGNPNRRLGRKPMRPSHIHNGKPTTATAARNPQKAVA